MDQALSALIEDIFDRGLEQQILVVVVGEFGRTPRMRYGPPDNSYGRDHWPEMPIQRCFPAVVWDGRGGRCDEQQSRVSHAQRLHATGSVKATIYRHLGIDHTQTLLDYSGRPVQILSEAKPIRELI
jgi:hypothetical protein